MKEEQKGEKPKRIGRSGHRHISPVQEISRVAVIYGAARLINALSYPPPFISDAAAAATSATSDAATAALWDKTRSF